MSLKMEELKKNDPVPGDIEELEDADDALAYEDEAVEEAFLKEEKNSTLFFDAVKKKAPRIAIFARYSIPAVFGIVLFAISFLDGVYFYMNGARMKMSLLAFYTDTLTAAHKYLAGATDAQANWFYGLLAGGAVVFALLYLLALALSVLAAITACRTFLAKNDTAIERRMRVIFKVAFPNRICLFLSNCLFLIPVLFPEYFSAVGKGFLSISGKEAVFVETNAFFVAACVMLAITLLLSVLIKNWEYQKNMNMFSAAPAEDDEGEDEEE